MKSLSRLTAWIPGVAWAGVIFFLSSLPHHRGPMEFWVLLSRKLAHVVEYAVLGWLFMNAVMRTWQTKDQRLAMAWSVIFCVLYAVSDEIHQSFSPGRNPAFYDVVIDALGVLIGVVFYGILLKWRERKL